MSSTGQQIIAIPILYNSSISKDNYTMKLSVKGTMKFVQLIEFHVRNIILDNS